MTQDPSILDASFDLWRSPWITLERDAGPPATLGIEEALLDAHSYTAIYDTSPLVVAGIHRLLTAILQAALNPRRASDLKQLWRSGQFPAEAIRSFGAQYAHRFDLFSPDEPFLQSSELPLVPTRSEKSKTVGYLIPEIPSGTSVIHYHHLTDDNHRLCPACVARGLVTIPCFATAYGRGNRPSINGVPPLYVIPGGRSLFESLAASLVLPEYQPDAASTDRDLVWWIHPPNVIASGEVIEVGYLHSLTFPARRIRMHPEKSIAACVRCGEISPWSVRTMVFDMGESRPKDAALWMDPFAAYQKTDLKGSKPPTPIRPREGKILWREFASLFLVQPASEKDRLRTIRPSILTQIAEEGLGSDLVLYPFRCVGIRTDMKAKIFEWIDAGFEVPTVLLSDEDAGWTIRRATNLAEEAAAIISKVFRNSFRGKSINADRHKDLRTRMEADFWADLATDFRSFVLVLAETGAASAVTRWADGVYRQAQEAFRQASRSTGDAANDLRSQALGQQKCNLELGSLRKKYLAQEGVDHDKP